MAQQQSGGDQSGRAGAMTLSELRRRFRGKSFGRLADLVTGLMMLGFAALGFLYAERPAGFDPITIWPFWMWAGLFVVGGLLLSPLLRPRRTILVVGFPLLVAPFLCEEPIYRVRAVLHGDKPMQPIPTGRWFRVISLNCGGGSEEAVRDTLQYDPDILLLQETPGRHLVERVLPEDWEYAGWLDPAVAVKGRLEADRHDRWLAHEMFVVRAVPEQLAEPAPITVISTRLVQPSLRLDIWRPSIWRKARDIRDARMNTIQNLLRQRRRYAEDDPVIIGGDFNTPDRDSLFRPLRGAGLTDAFAEVGKGWPNTITSDYPMERIDYIWVNEHLEPLSGFVEVTEHSDHRMVVVDVALR